MPLLMPMYLRINPLTPNSRDPIMPRGEEILTENGRYARPFRRDNRESDAPLPIKRGFLQMLFLFGQCDEDDSSDDQDYA